MKIESFNIFKKTNFNSSQSIAKKPTKTAKKKQGDEVSFLGTYQGCHVVKK